jgi:hypothetical protein
MLLTFFFFLLILTINYCSLKLYIIMKPEMFKKFLEQEYFFYKNILPIREMGLELNFDDLYEVSNQISSRFLNSDYIITVIPKGMDPYLLFFFLQERMNMDINYKSLADLQSERVARKNYIIVFPKSFYKKTGGRNYKPLTFLEGLILNARVFLETNHYLDESLDRIPVFTGSVIGKKHPYVVSNPKTFRAYLEITNTPSGIFTSPGRIRIYGL